MLPVCHNMCISISKKENSKMIQYKYIPLIKNIFCCTLFTMAIAHANLREEPKSPKSDGLPRSATNVDLSDTTRVVKTPTVWIPSPPRAGKLPTIPESCKVDFSPTHDDAPKKTGDISTLMLLIDDADVRFSLDRQFNGDGAMSGFSNPSKSALTTTMSILNPNVARMFLKGCDYGGFMHGFTEWHKIEMAGYLSATWKSIALDFLNIINYGGAMHTYTEKGKYMILKHLSHMVHDLKRGNPNLLKHWQHNDLTQHRERVLLYNINRLYGEKSSRGH